MLNYGFEKLKRIDLCTEGQYCYEIPVIDGEKNYLKVTNQDSSYLICENTGVIKEYVKLAKYATSPIKSGDIFGEVIYTVDNKELARINLVATENIDCKTKNKLIDKILSIFK